MSARRGFTLLEVMVAIAILGLGLTAILSAQAGAFASAAHARNISQAVGLSRCKMLEVEEYVLRNGFEQTDVDDEGPCCDGDDTIPMHCAWRIEAPTLPTPEYGQLDLSSVADPSNLGPLGSLLQPGGAKDMFGSSSNVTDIAQQLFGGGAVGAGADPTALAQGLAPGANPLDPSQLDGGVPGAGLLGDPNDPAAMPGGASGNPMDAISGIVMTMVYPDLKTYFESSARRITVDLTWREGVKNYTLTIEQWVVQPQPGLPDDEDDPTADDSVALTPGGRPTGSHGSTRANPSRMLPTAPHLGAKP